MLKKQIALENMRHLVTHDWHGYSQISRWGDGEGVCNVEAGGVVSQLEQGDRDCSSAIISAYEAAGISCGGATYTGNMRACMCASGNFVWHPMTSGYVAKPGDVYLNESYHTAMCLSSSPDMLMEFSISETGGIDGAEGDQTGWESHTCAYYNYPWDGILECINTESVATAGRWIKDSIGWWYKNPDGSWPKSQWIKLDAWYYFNDKGYALSDQWMQYKGKWYYLQSDCRMATGWIRVKGHWYYLDKNGAMKTGWIRVKDHWYYLRKSEGSAVTGWLQDGDYKYYLFPKKAGEHPECAAASGWTKIDGDWYYFNVDKNCQPICSMMRNHWIVDEKIRYYLKEDGRMARNEVLLIGEKEYEFDGSGAEK